MGTELCDALQRNVGAGGRCFAGATLLWLPHHPRQPADGVVMEYPFENRPGQRQTLVAVSLVLDRLVGSEEFPIALISLVALRERLCGIVFRHDDQVGRIEDAVLVLD